MLAEDPALARCVMTALAEQVQELVALMGNVTLRSATGRLAHFLLELDHSVTADGTVELPRWKRHLASHLNLTGESLSRSLRRLADAGLIAKIDNRHIKVLDPHGLRKVAEGMFAEPDS